jgi:hypothetical protein
LNYFADVAGGFNVSDTDVVLAKSVRNSTVTVTKSENLLYCDHTWMALLCLSALMMLFAATASAVLSFLRIAPDSTDFLSALSLNSGTTLLGDGTFLDANKRIRLLKDVKLKLEMSSLGTKLDE